MFLLENIKISHKLIAFASLTLASLFIIAFLSVVKMQIALSAIPELTHSITFVDDARHAEAIFKELRISAIKVPMTISKEQLDSFKKAYKTNRGHFNELLDRMINNNTCSGYKECLNVINVMSEKLHDYDKAKDEVIRLTEEDKRVDAFLAVERLLVPIGDDIDKNVNKIISIASDLSDTSVNKVYDRCNPFILYIVAIFTFTILTITIYFIGRSIIIPIQKLSRDSKIIASGDLTVKVDGDLQVDDHHTIEDTGIVLGQAIARAAGNKKGIARYGSRIIPMDETLVLCAVDLCGRPYFSWNAEFQGEKMGGMSTQMVKEFFYAVSYSAMMNLHLKVLTPGNDHHMCEAMFKAFGKALDMATAKDPRITDVLSTKGSI